MKISFLRNVKQKTVWNYLSWGMSYKSSRFGGLLNRRNRVTVKPLCYISDCSSNFEGLLLTLHARLFQTVFFVLCFSEVMFLFMIKMFMLKAIEIEIAFFQSLGNPKGRTLDNCLARRSLRKIINSTLGMPIHRWLITDRRPSQLYPPASNLTVNREKVVHLGLRAFRKWIQKWGHVCFSRKKWNNLTTFPILNRGCHFVFSQFPKRHCFLN